MASDSDFLAGALPQIALFAASSWLIFHLAKGIYQAYFGPLRHIPGPKPWIIFPFIPKVKTLLGTFDQDLRRFHKRYGSVVRYAPNSITFTTGQAWKTIYGPAHGQFPKFLGNQQIEPQSNILSADDANHARIRRGVAHAFAPRSLAEQEPMIHSFVELLVRRLSDVADSRVPAEMGKWFHITSFDIIADLTFGESLGGLEKNDFHHVVDAVLLFIERGKKLFTLNDLLGPLAWLARPVIAPGVEKGFMDQYNYTRAAVGKRLEKGSDVARKDFMSGLLRGMGDKDINSTEELITNANTLFVAGSDTTATLLTACAFYLLATPHAHKKAVEEVRSAFESAADINFTNATARLPYLLAVLNETFRLYPPVATSLERIVPQTEEPIHIDGVCLPPGVSAQPVIVTYSWHQPSRPSSFPSHLTDLPPQPLTEFNANNNESPVKTHVGVHQSSAGLSASNFAQPESFAPERWLPGAAQDPSSPFFADKRDAIQPFSYGPRNCVGKHLAYNEMRLIMARLLWEFDLRLDPSSRGWTQPYSEHKTWVVWRKPPLFVQITKRDFAM